MVSTLLLLGGGKVAHAARVTLDASVDGSVEYVTSAPKGTFTSSPTEGLPRPVAGREVRGGYGPLTFLAVGANLGVVVDRRYWISLLGMRIGGAIGPYAPVLRAADGSPAELRPARAWHVDVDAIGFRVRHDVRRWGFGAGFAFGASILVVPTTVGIGADGYDGNTLGVSPFLRAHVEVCRRVDPVARACLVVSPFIRQYQWFDGGSVALRWEVTP